MQNGEAQRSQLCFIFRKQSLDILLLSTPGKSPRPEVGLGRNGCGFIPSSNAVWPRHTNLKLFKCLVFNSNCSLPVEERSQVSESRVFFNQNNQLHLQSLPAKLLRSHRDIQQAQWYNCGIDPRSNQSQTIIRCSIARLMILSSLGNLPRPEVGLDVTDAGLSLCLMPCGTAAPTSIKPVM